MLNLQHACKVCKNFNNFPINEIHMEDLTKDDALTIFKCENCGSENIIEESIIKYITINDEFATNWFVYPQKMIGKAKIVIGKTNIIELPEPISNIEAMNLTPTDDFEIWADYPTKSQYQGLIKFFKVISSVRNGSKVKLGEEKEVVFNIYSNTNEEESLWLRFIKQAKLSLLENNYSMTILCSEISVESFINMILRSKLVEKGNTPEDANKIIKSYPDIYNKMYTQLKVLDNIIFKTDKNLNKSWQKLVVERNKIGHGSKMKNTEQEAIEFFDTAIKTIFSINRKSSRDYIYNNYIG